MFRKRHVYWTAGLIALMLTVRLAIGQTPRSPAPLEPDAGASFLVVDMSQVLPGASLKTRRVCQLPVAGTSSYHYPAIEEIWREAPTSSRGTVITSCVYAYLPTRTEAASAYQDVMLSSFQAGSALHRQGWDAVFGRYPRSLVAVRDRSVVSLLRSVNDYDLQEDDKRVFEAFLDIVHTRLATATEAPGFQVGVDVLSKHVNRKKGQVARVRVTFTQQDYFPLEGEMWITPKPAPQQRRAGIINQALQKGDQGTLEFTWDGRDDKGELVPNGVYAAAFRSWDRIRRTKISGPFDIEVNNQ